MRRIPGGIFAIASLLIAAFALCEWRGFSTNDVGIWLALGRDMALHGGWGDVEKFTHTVAGTRYLDGAWAAARVFHAAYVAGGYPLLTILDPLCVVLALAVTAAAALRLSSDDRVAAGATLLALLLFVDNLLLRPQILVLPLFALVAALAMARESLRAGEIAAIALATALWTNLHGSFLLAPVVLGLAAAGLAWERRSLRVAQSHLAALGAAVLATLVNPYGPGIYSYVRGNMGGSAGRGIREWSPPTLHEPVGITLLVVALSLAFVFWRWRPRFARRDLPLLGAFLVLGLSGRRYVLWLGIVGALALARAYRRETRPERLGIAVLPAASALAAFLLVAIALSPWKRAPGRDDASAAVLFPRDSPVGAVAWAAQHGVSGNVFNSMEWGGWIEWRLPEAKTFVDARIWIFPDPLWREYVSASAAGPGWEETLDAHQVSAVLLSHYKDDPLIDALSASPRWKRGYADDHGVVFVRQE